MPEKTVNYRHVIFPPEVLMQAFAKMREMLGDIDVDTIGGRGTLWISEDETWRPDSEEEFFADYRKDFVHAGYEVSFIQKKTYFTAGKLGIFADGVKSDLPRTKVTVQLSTRDQIEKIFNVFDTESKKYTISPKIRVFIGHGHSPLWRDLKDHLHEKHGYDVEAYEIGTRAGFTIKDVLDSMLTASTIAFLVFTGEDLDPIGQSHARENVIHELGLFQGRLGWNKAIVLLEEDVVEFSNIHGLNQIRFHKGNIRETFGEVLATIRREFAAKESA